jgi:hypothetical protein
VGVATAGAGMATSARPRVSENDILFRMFSKLPSHFHFLNCTQAIMSKQICVHCGEELADIRIARIHHIRCPQIKFGGDVPSCANLKGCAVDACFKCKDVEVVFHRMEKPMQPEVLEHAAKSAFERQSSYDQLAKKFFPDGPCHTKVTNLPEETLDAAWEFFGKLEKRAEMATSMASRSVNRNRTGFKKRDFKPMLYAITCAKL